MVAPTGPIAVQPDPGGEGPAEDGSLKSLDLDGVLQEGGKPVLPGDMRDTGRPDHMEGSTPGLYSLVWMRARAAQGKFD